MIHFSINKKRFIQALMISKRAISTKNAIPILSTLKIKVTTSGISLTASNGQISIENSIPIDDKNAGLLINQTGAILLEANFFINVVSSLPDVTLDFKELSHHQVLLVSGASEITLKGKDVDQYPRLQDVTQTEPLLLETRLLKEVISETAFAASQQESRPILTGIHLVLKEEKYFKAVATDSHRLSQRQLLLDKVAETFDVVIPSRSLKEFLSVFTDNIEQVEVFFSDSQILFRSEHISFYTRLLEGTYPDTDRLLVNQFETEVLFKTHYLKQVMERAALVANATQNGTVKLEIAHEMIKVHVNSPEVGQVHEILECEQVTGQDLTISFNPTYLIDALKALNSETVQIQFVSSVRPFTLTPGDDSENFIQLITPVRTN